MRHHVIFETLRHLEFLLVLGRASLRNRSSLDDAVFASGRGRLLLLLLVLLGMLKLFADVVDLLVGT